MAKNEMFKVIDFESYRVGCETLPSDEQLKSIASDIAGGLSGGGLIILKNSGIAKEKDDKVWECYQKFRQLSEDDKEKYAIIPEDITGVDICVYSRPNYFGNYSGVPASNVEAFTFYSRVKRGSLRYPEEEVPDVVEVMTDLSEDLITLCIRVLECLAIGQGQDRHTYDYCLESLKSRDCFDKNVTMTRLNYYRPLDIVKVEGLPQMRLGGHTDLGIITATLPDGEGLQVQAKEGTWVDVPYIPGTCLIQVGSLLTHMTDIHAPFHQVLFTGDENDNKSRRSTVLLIYPDKDVYMKAAAGAADQTPKRQRDLGIDASARNW